MQAKPILFCDFDGVLCHDRYWRSLPKEHYEKIQVLLFGEDVSLINDWMRGKYSSEEINQKMSEHTGVPFQEIWDTFIKDCQTMHVDEEILQKLDKLRNSYTVILFTGNMDSFTRFTVPALGLERYFDLISNSFDEGLMKTENDGELFVKYLKRFDAPIADSIVFDDSPRVGKVFERLGGKSYLVTKDVPLGFHLEKI
jgi:FMN phosphatase YigB (HAD superfamily)